MNRFFYSKNFLSTLFCALFLSGAIQLYAGGSEMIINSDSCVYSLNIFDSLGDGWNGNTVVVTSGNTSLTVTLETGTSASYQFTAYSGESITLEYVEGGSINVDGSFKLSDSYGVELYASGFNPAYGVAYDAVADCTCPNVDNSTFVATTFQDSIFLSWEDNNAESYTIEYGPAGFPVGEGALISTLTNSVGISPLNSGLSYDFYIVSDCGDNLSPQDGPVTFKTELDPAVGSGNGTCILTLDLFDSLGDGWNGSVLTIESNGQSTDYTFTTGSSASFEVIVDANSVVNVSYLPGFFEDEVSYVISDSEGNIILENGPFPPQGQNFFSFVSCGFGFDLDYTLADLANFSWSEAEEEGGFILEIGDINFIRGTGTAYNFSDETTSGETPGLQENTYYAAYLTFIDADDEIDYLIGPIIFKTTYFVDVGVSGFIDPSVIDCEIDEGLGINVVLKNYGQYPQTLIPVSYGVNGELADIEFPFDGNYTGVIGYNYDDDFAFNEQYDFSEPGEYYITAWTHLEEDSNASNDTFEIVVKTANYLPLKEDFELVALPEGWTSSVFNGFYPANSHNNPTACWGTNLWISSNPQAELTTDRYVIPEEGASLTFEYRYTYFADGAGFDITDNKLSVQISTDCGETYDQTIYVIDGSNHTPSAEFALVEIPLDDFAGEAINLRFLAEWTVEDYWIDIDNINILGCPPTFGIYSTITEETSSGVENGSIQVTEPVLGQAPYTYLWDVDLLNNSPILNNVGIGFYQLTIIDDNGCSEVYNYTIGSPNSTENQEIAFNLFEVMPNPTSGLLYINIELAEQDDLNIEVLDNVGRVVQTIKADQVKDWSQSLDMSDFASGMYFLRAYSNQSLMTKRIVLNK